LYRLAVLHRQNAAEGHANEKHRDKRHSNYTVIRYRTKPSHLLVQKLQVSPSIFDVPFTIVALIRNASTIVVVSYRRTGICARSASTGVLRQSKRQEFIQLATAAPLEQINHWILLCSLNHSESLHCKQINRENNAASIFMAALRELGRSASAFPFGACVCLHRRCAL
jgi:hypothetical protein